MLLSLRWWCKKARVSVLVALAGATFLAFAAAGGSAGTSDGVSLDVKDAPLSLVVAMLTQKSGINFVIADPEVNTKRITARLDGQPLEAVLDHVLKPAGIRYHKTEDGTYVIGEAGTDVTQTIAPLAVPASQGSAEAAKPVRKTRRESIKLQHSCPSELLRVMGWTPDRSQGMPAMNPIEVNESFPDKPTTPDTPRQYGPAGTMVQPLNKNQKNNEPVAPALDSSGLNGPAGAGRTATAADGASQYVGASARPNYGGSYGGAYGGTTAYGGNNMNRPGTTNTTNTGSSNSGLLPEGIDFVMPYDLDNSIVVRGDDEGIAEFKDLVHMLDISPKQVQIKAEFIEVSTTDAANFGIEWSVQSLNASFNTAFNPTGNVIIGVQTGNVSATLKAELSQTKGRVVNSPIISTLNNTPASITIGKTIPFFSSVVQTVGDGQTVNSQQLTELPVQTYLWCLPRVNGDGSITLYMEPSIQDTGRIFEGAGTQFPERSFQTVKTNRRVMSGQTIVVGGFIRKNDTASLSKVPILGDLPLIGSLFRSKSDSQDERELLIFVTPTIIPDKSGGSVGVQP